MEHNPELIHPAVLDRNEWRLSLSGADGDRITSSSLQGNPGAEDDHDELNLDDDGDDDSMVDDHQQEDPSIDFRILLSHSKYDQIERELLKMFQQRRRNNNVYKHHPNCPQQQKCSAISHHHQIHLERSLLDIEEDLHKILLLLVKQLEMISDCSRRIALKQHLKSRSSQDTQTDIIEPAMKSGEKYRKKTINETLAKTSTSLDDNFEKAITMDLKQTKSATGLKDREEPVEKIADPNDHHHHRPESEYSQLCFESDERFRQKFSRIQQQNATIKPNQQSSSNYHHYRITKPDVDFILGSNGKSESKSHSRLASKQMQLARLKQHNSLCTKIGDFQRSQIASSKQNNQHQIIKQIQTLIDELHLEHDWISKKLHHYQQENQAILGRNRTLWQLADKVNLQNMFTLSEHLIHIMDHLYELHQLNKKHLKQILDL